MDDKSEVEGTLADGPICIVMSDDEPTAEVSFPKEKKSSKDYDRKMDFHVFMRWLQKRLWPVFKA